MWSKRLSSHAELLYRLWHITHAAIGSNVNMSLICKWALRAFGERFKQAGEMLNSCYSVNITEKLGEIEGVESFFGLLSDED